MFKYVVLCFVLINVLIFITVFKKPQKRQKQSKYDCAIVCGFPANSDGSPSLIMKSRVEKAIELYCHNKIDYIIFSGGKVHNTYEEAAIMEKYAISLGLDKKIIIKENKAISTFPVSYTHLDVYKRQNQYNEGLVQYQNGYSQYLDGVSEYNKGYDQYSDGLKQYNDCLLYTSRCV